jgi:hypothetical protein
MTEATKKLLKAYEQAFNALDVEYFITAGYHRFYWCLVTLAPQGQPEEGIPFVILFRWRTSSTRCSGAIRTQRLLCCLPARSKWSRDLRIHRLGV